MLYALDSIIQSGNQRILGVLKFTIKYKNVKPFAICFGEDIAIKELGVAELPSGARRSPHKHSISGYYRMSSL